MVLDIIAIVIIIALVVIGFFNGFARTLANTVGWVGAIILGFVFSPAVKSYLLEHTQLYENFKTTIIEKGFAGSNPVSDGSMVPEIVRNTGNTVTEFLTKSIAENLAMLFMSIISFIIVIVLVKLVLFLLVHLFSRRNRDGFTGMTDAVIGAAIGGVQGFFWLFLILALVFPVIGLVAPDFSATLMDWINNSTFVKSLYNHNLLLIFVQSLF